MLARPISATESPKNSPAAKQTRTGLNRSVGDCWLRLTTVLLYLSYNYQPVGLSTTLHFIYPAAMALGCILLFKEKLGRVKLFALVLSMAGVLFFADFHLSGSFFGFFSQFFQVLLMHFT